MNKLLLKLSLLVLLVSVNLITLCQVNSGDLNIDRLYEKTGEQYFSVRVSDRSAINDLSRIISIDKVDPTGKVFAYANKKEFQRFLELGLPFEILRHPGIFEGNLNMKSEIDIRDIEEWDFYPTFDAYVDMMYQFAEEYPELCQITSFGTTIMGRQLLAAKISDNIGVRENEPQVLYTSSIHGDETTGYILTLRLIDYLLSNYGTDQKVTNIVDNIEIWINPLANPDGTYHGGNSTVNNAIRYNANWVDMNRNYPDPEDGPHPDGEEWQPETILFMQLAEDNNFVSSINFHGGEVVCNYPWDTWSRLAADDDWWQYVCHEYADTVHENCPWGYMTDFDNGITNGYQWYSISGGRQDYMNYFQQCREFTLEISETKLMQPDSLPFYWDYNYRSLLNYLEQSMYGLRGTVKDSVSGWPVQAEVYAILFEKDSSWVYSELPNGNYHRLLPEGNYSVRYSAPGYISRVINNISITNRQATILDVKLVPEGVGGIENNAISKLIQFYPNPLTGNTLYYQTDIDVESISIYDLAGKKVMDVEVDIESHAIILGPLKNGLYFVRIDTKNGTGLKKLVINQ